MTARQHDLVQATWARILPLSDIAVEVFYARLFHLDPELREFLSERLAEQKRMLMPMLAVLVHGLDEPGSIPPILRVLTRRSAAEDLRHASPAALRLALRQTLREVLGPLCSAETENAWHAFADLICDTLVNARRPPVTS